MTGFRLLFVFNFRCLLLFLLFYAFNCTAQNWVELNKSVASDRASGDQFGSGVSISANYAIVGAYEEDENENGTASLSAAGSCYIYSYSNGVWIQQQKIVASDRAADDYFGFTVAISGDYAIVGAVGEDEDSGGFATMNAAGSAYIFKQTNGVWLQQQKIVASDRSAGDEFGRSVSISGDYAVIGARYEDEDETGSATLNQAGSAYVFKQINGVWVQQQKITAADRGAGDEFGRSVAVSGNHIIVGAYAEDEDVSGGATLASAGSAYFFERTGEVWTQQQKVVASDRGVDDRFGNSVEISGDYAIVGAVLEDEDQNGGATLTDAGSAYLFKYTNGVWYQQQKLTAADRDSDDFFGIMTAISGDYAIVGAYREADDVLGGAAMDQAGSAYVFKRTGEVWVQQKIVASDRQPADFFGYRVGISGEHLLVSAVQEDEDTEGLNTLENSGSVYFFTIASVTGSEQYAANTRLVFPNPAVDIIRIETTFNNGIYTISDLTGKPVLSGIFNTPAFTADISQLTLGVYFITLADSCNSITSLFKVLH